MVKLFADSSTDMINKIGNSLAFSLAIGLAASSCAPATKETTTDSSSSSTSSTCEPGSRDCSCKPNDGCNSGLLCVNGVCEAMGEETTSSTSDSTISTSNTSQDGSSDSSTTSTYDGNCDPNEGVINSACSMPSEPYCLPAGTCSDCSALESCTQVDANLGVCDPQSGFCVECTEDSQDACGGTTPTCDPVTHTCVPCSEQSQCASGACNLDTGACFDKKIYVYRDIKQNGKCTETVDLNAGTKELPYCYVVFAVKHIKQFDPTTPTVIELLPNAPSTNPSTQIINDPQKPLTLAIVQIDNPLPDSEFKLIDNLAYHIQAKGDVTLYLNNFDVESLSMFDKPNLECLDGARMYVDRVRAHGGIGPGIRGNKCELLSVTNSSFFKNKSGGIEMIDGTLVLRNTFVTDNGVHNEYGGGGLYVDNAVVDIAYSTFFLNHSLDSLGDSIHCTTKALPGSIVRNSIIARSEVIKTNPSINCLDLAINHSLVDGGEMQGSGNVKMTVPAINALIKGDYPIGAYRLKGKAEADTVRGIAIWKDNDPRTDFEKDPRAAINDGEEIPGADVFVP